MPAGLKTIIALSFVLAIGFLLVILSAALWHNYLPLLVVATYIIAPLPNWICGRCANPDDFMESTSGGVVDFGRWLTGFLVLMGIALPALLAHSGAIQIPAMVMSVLGGLLIYGTIISFSMFFQEQEEPVDVFPDTFFRLDALNKNIVDILQAYSPSQIKFIPAWHLQGLNEEYVRLGDLNTVGICIEQLVDGMNLDKTWCLDHLDTSRPNEMRAIWGFVDSKKDRLQLVPDNITGLVATEQQAKNLQMIPGYNELAGAIKK
ncbi:Vacuolar protein sorting-associated protein 55 [Myotisia sp. PD_48]|nr:Vacuolar protein sorting-associated protein 55 [Myotisia sp. PD_48]